MKMKDRTHFVSITQSSTDVTWTEPEVRDNSGVYTVWSSKHPGEAFDLGTTPVTYNAIDSSGNVKTITFNITVVGKVQACFHFIIVIVKGIHMTSVR